MHDSNNDHDLVGAYALDALSPEERATFESHLRGCSACQAEVAELQAVVDTLPLAAQAVEPPASLRDRILSEASRDLPESPPRLTSLSGGAPAPRMRSRFRMPEVLFAVAAAVIIAALGIYNLQVQRNLHDEQQKAAFGQQVMAALQSGATVRAVAGTSYAPSAQAAMVVPPHNGSPYLLVQGLPSPPANKVYQLWLLHGSIPRSAGVFSYSGASPVRVAVTAPIRGSGAAAVTVEPGPRGSRAPTGKKLLVGRLTA